MRMIEADRADKGNNMQKEVQSRPALLGVLTNRSRVKSDNSRIHYIRLGLRSHTNPVESQPGCGHRLTNSLISDGVKNND